MARSNCTVAVRVRPFGEAELNAGGQNVISVKDQHIRVKGFDRGFAFDHCFPDEINITQERVYQEIGAQLTKHSLEGFNTCIFAYGQTGSGKTHTMMGADDPESQEHKGIIPRLCDDLFSQLTSHSSATNTVKCEVSFFEIYNERVNCLLSEDVKEKLKVREHPVTGPYVEGLTKKVVGSFEDVYPLIEQGNESRTVAETRYNQRSSRSHAVFTIIITQTIIDEDTGHCIDRVSRVNLVDLAGSERLSPGPNVNEGENSIIKDGININRSLSTLGRVIHALSERGDKTQDSKRSSVSVESSSSWVAYRDSVLTWLLKENLGGNSKTVMLACISPSSTQFEETLNTLRYADRVKQIRNNAIVNDDQNSRLIQELHYEIKYLRGKLEESGLVISPPRKGSTQPGGPPRAPQRKSSNTSLTDVGTATKSQELCASKLESSEQIITDLNLHWERKMAQLQTYYSSKLSELSPIGDPFQTPGCPVADAPLLVSLDPHLVPGEYISWSILCGDTLVTSDTAQHEIDTEDSEVETRTIRLTDGFNLCDPHCLISRTEESVTLSPAANAITFVDGQLLTDTIELSHATRLIFGSSHAFYYLDPVEAKKLRDARKKQAADRLPKVLDWAYASNEFAQVMECYKPYEEVIKLQDEVEYWRSLTSEDRHGSDAVTKSCLLLVSEPKTPPSGGFMHPKPGLVYPLSEGLNKISSESWGLQNLPTFYIDLIRGQLYKRETEEGSPSPLCHGMKLVLGQNVVLVNCPLSPIDPDMVHPSVTTTKVSPRKHSPRGKSGGGSHGNKEVDRQLVLKESDVGGVLHGLTDLQYQLLAMHDVLYGLPPEMSEISQEEAAEQFSEEVIELLNFKRGLKDTSVLELQPKNLGVSTIKSFLSRLTKSLRVITHQFTRRLDFPPPSPFDGCHVSPQYADPTPPRQISRSPVLLRGSPRRVTPPPSPEKKKDKALQEEVNRLQRQLSSFRESHNSDMEALVNEFALKESDSSIQLKTVQSTLSIEQEHCKTLEENLKKTNEELTQLKQLNCSSEAHLDHRLKRENAEMMSKNEELEGEMEVLIVKLRLAKHECETMRNSEADQRKVSDAKASERLSALQVECRDLKESLDSNQETNRKDRKNIKKLKQQLAEQNVLVQALEEKVTGAQQLATEVAAKKEKEEEEITLDRVIGKIKSELLPLGLAILPVVDRIAHDIQVKGISIASRAIQTLLRALPGDEGQFDRGVVARSLRELAIYYDMFPTSDAKDLLYTDVLQNGKQVMRLASLIRSTSGVHAGNVDRRSPSPRPLSRIPSDGRDSPAKRRSGGHQAPVETGRESPAKRRSGGHQAPTEAGRESPAKRRSGGHQVPRGLSPSRYATPEKRRSANSATVRSSRRPSPHSRTHSAARDPSLSKKHPPPRSNSTKSRTEYNVSVPATIASLREREREPMKIRSDTANRRYRIGQESPRSQLASRIFQRDREVLERK